MREKVVKQQKWVRCGWLLAVHTPLTPHDGDELNDQDLYVTYSHWTIQWFLDGWSGHL